MLTNSMAATEISAYPETYVPISHKPENSNPLMNNSFLSSTASLYTCFNTLSYKFKIKIPILWADSIQIMTCHTFDMGAKKKFKKCEVSKKKKKKIQHKTIMKSEHVQKYKLIWEKFAKPNNFLVFFLGQD